MRIAVLGAGAVGSYFGGRLAQADRDVVFVARGKTLEALRSNGLHIESILGDVQLSNIEATDDVSALRAADIVLVAVKSHQLAEVADAIVPVLSDSALVLPLQNGIQSYEILSSALGTERVIHGFCRILSTIAAPGHVRHVGAEPTILCGELNPQISTRTDAIIKAFHEVYGITIAIQEDILRAIWEKFLFVAAFGTVGAAVRFPIGVLRSIPEARQLLRTSMQEVIAVGRAEGVLLPPDAEVQGLAEFEALPAAGTSSLQRDLAAGRPSELIGTIAPLLELAEAHHVSIPVNAALYAALLPSELKAQGKLQGESRL
jgi:2-dehydropantoate 2-reductase